MDEAERKDEMSPEEKDALWQNEAHWSGGIYFCKRDPRLWVPKRPKWAGYTVNFGHRRGTAMLLLFVLSPLLTLIAINILTVALLAGGR